MCDASIDSVSGFSPEIHDISKMAESVVFRLDSSKEDERMVDKEMLTAIAELLDEKLEEKLEQKLEEKLEEKLDQKLDQKLDEKLDKKQQPVYDRLVR